MIKKIGVLTSGGDAPGMNAADAWCCSYSTCLKVLEVYGVFDGYLGLYEDRIEETWIVQAYLT